MLIIVLLQWNPHSYNCAFTRLPTQVNLPSEDQRALAHPEDTQGFLIGDFAFGDAFAIVEHLESELTALTFQSDFDARGLRVTRHIGESLLQNAKHRRRAVEIERYIIIARTELTFDACACLKLFRLPFDGGLEPQVIEYFWTQFPNNFAHFLDAVIHQLRGGTDLRQHIVTR